MPTKSITCAPETVRPQSPFLRQPPNTTRFSARSLGRNSRCFRGLQRRGSPLRPCRRCRNPLSPGRYSLNLLTVGVLVGSPEALKFKCFLKRRSFEVCKYLWVGKHSQVELTKLV